MVVVITEHNRMHGLRQLIIIRSIGWGYDIKV